MGTDTLTTYTYTLPSGAEIEIEGIEEKRFGASDSSAKAVGDRKIPFEKIIAPLGEMANVLFTSVKSAVQAPDTVTLEFGASLKGQTKLLIMSGEGQGSIKVSLTWKKQ